MNEDVAAAIRRAYPDGNLENRDEAVFDSPFNARPRFWKSVLSGIAASTHFEIYEAPWLLLGEEIDRDFWISNSRALHLEHSRMNNFGFSKLLKQEDKTLTLLHFQVSRIAPFFLRSWRALEPQGESVRITSPSAAPSKEWLAEDLRACKALEGQGFRLLAQSEFLEAVDWINPGNSFAAAGGLNVYACLFREVG